MTKNAKLQRSVIETSADGEEGLEWTGDLARHNEGSSRLQFCRAGKYILGGLLLKNWSCIRKAGIEGKLPARGRSAHQIRTKILLQ